MRKSDDAIASANSLFFEQAALSVTTQAIARPPAVELVEALLKAEKLARKNPVRYSFEQLTGTWQLCFITGTKKTREKAGIVLGAGRYVPQFVKILLTYSNARLGTLEQPVEAGSLENLVELGALKLALTGPN